MADKETENQTDNPDEEVLKKPEKKKTLEELRIEEEENQRKSVQRLLAEAITHGAPLEDIRIIIKYGGDVNGVVNRGLRPIHYAAYSNNTDIIRLLLKLGADINVKDDVGYTALHLCARKGHYNCMKYLIKRGARINIESHEYSPVRRQPTAVSADGEQAANESTAQNDGSEVVTQSDGSQTVVHDASRRPSQRIMEDLTIEPINLALENNHVAIVKLLLENGAKANRRYFMGYEINLVPLSNIECLDLLLQYGADPNSVNRCGYTPLMKAAKENEMLAIRLLLRYGSNVNQQCPERFEQKTALHFALEAGNHAIARTLLLQKSEPSKPPNYKYSALHTAVLTDRVDLVELLLLFPINVNELSDDDCTALMLACASTSLINLKEIIDLLLQAGANPNIHADIINYIAPCFSPMVEYLRNHETIDYDIVLNLIQHGATVHFAGFTTVVRKRNPFGILFYLTKVIENEKLLNLLIESCSLFDPYAIDRCKNFSEEEKKMFSEFGMKPLPLKNLLRFSLRNLLMPNLLVKIPKLPLPDILKKYLTFETI